MKKIVCFGDSITEMGFVIEVRGYVAQLADRYARRADVLARGFSGYTTREAVKILDAAVLAEKPDIVILFFGANDSTLPGQIQHVPPKEYKRNLLDMASRIAVAGAWLVLVTPPPVNEKLIKSRTLGNTAAYAKICLDVAREMNLPVVDLFMKLQEEAGWQKNALIDGLHLSANGMTRLYEELAMSLDKIQTLDSIQRMEIDGI
jgi:lysophospholipase L1-like esterase